MTAKIKIRGATPSTVDGEPCYNCIHHKRVQGSKPSQEYRLCSLFGERIKMRVTECTEYMPHNAPTLNQMMVIAWPLCADKKGNLIGFKSQEEANKLQQDGKLAPAKPSVELDDYWS